jgi:hypothetical protein
MRSRSGISYVPRGSSGAAYGLGVVGEHPIAHAETSFRHARADLCCPHGHDLGDPGRERGALFRRLGVATPDQEAPLRPDVPVDQRGHHHPRRVAWNPLRDDVGLHERCDADGIDLLVPDLLQKASQRSVDHFHRAISFDLAARSLRRVTDGEQKRCQIAGEA